LDREAVPRDVRDGGGRGRGCADAEEATTGEAEFIARVEEVAGPEYARFACPEAGRGPSSSSAGREVQLPYRERHGASVLLQTGPAEVVNQPIFTQIGRCCEDPSEAVPEKGLTMAHNVRCTPEAPITWKGKKTPRYCFG
jgi:hypothetical protein